MSDQAIRISNLCKSYRIHRDDTPRATNIGEALSRKLRAPFKKMPSETFWALKDIDLEIQKGEVVGVIGRNGAGKSTLLKVLSRITEPTSGRIELFGRVGSLLEVGTGFHPELTGRENIFLNGAILGMQRREIKKQFDAIVDFAGVEKFLDTPVKRYSSGMYVRLAFAVAAHLNPEILIVDEVLAVGDAEFQKKCLGKMQDVAQEGRTVLFVSHNEQAIQALCSHAILLKNGQIVQSGVCSDVLSEYLKSSRHTTSAEVPTSEVLESLQVLTLSGHSHLRAGEDLSIEMICKNSIVVKRQLTGIKVNLVNESGAVVTTFRAAVEGSDDQITDRNRFVCTFEGRLLPGVYAIDLTFSLTEGRSISEHFSCCFEVHEGLLQQRLINKTRNDGYVCLKHSWGRPYDIVRTS